MMVIDGLNWSTHYLQNHRIENPRLNAELLLAFSLHMSREGLYTDLHRPLKKKDTERLQRLVKRRISGEPLQYILGHQEFWSIDLKVDSRALIPRHETELLVEQGLRVLSEMASKRTPFVLEVGTGSGAIAVALAKDVRDILIVATDLSLEALWLAQENAKSTGVLNEILFVCGDLFGPFRAAKGHEPFDLVVSNPPYIASSQILRLPNEIKGYEPIIALNGGEDGLESYRKIIPQVSQYLRSGGWLLLEVGQDQGPTVSTELERGGDFSKPELIRDLSGVERVVRTQKR